VPEAPEKLDYERTSAPRRVDWAAVLLVMGIAIVIAGAAIGLIFYFFVWYTLKVP
jgi:uncharacterized protein (DUF2062 family)